MNTTAYAICAAWLARTYKHHNCTRELQPQQVRYSFRYTGQLQPFFVLQVSKAGGVLYEYTRIKGQQVHTATGYPVITDRDNAQRCRYWNGDTWQHKNTPRSLSSFALYLTCGEVAIHWRREVAQCQ